MSDYLSTLVERSLSAQAAVRPQTISIFEAPPLEGGVSFPGSVVSAPREVGRVAAEFYGKKPRSPSRSAWLGSAEEKQTANVESPLPEVSSRPRIESPRRKSVERVSRDELALPEAAGESRSALTTSIAPLTYLPNDAPKAVSSQEIAAEERDPAPLAPKSRTLRMKSSRLMEEETKGALTDAAGGNKEAAAPADARVGSASPQQVTRVIPAQSSRPVSPASIIPASIVPSPRPFAPLSRREEAKAESPSIHITIGRLEVRATTPPTARPRPAATKAPTLSLDQYLRQRAEGDRR